jgi:Lon protease-like protein
MEDAAADRKRFGVVLIERGREVGGGDHRFTVGTEAHVVGMGPSGDGDLTVLAVGMHRFEVDDWLPDDPYPVACVNPLEDEDGIPSAADLERCSLLLRRIYALASELGSEVGVLPELSDDPQVAMWELCTNAPVGQLDRQRLLESVKAAERLNRLATMLEEGAAVVEARLAGG